MATKVQCTITKMFEQASQNIADNANASVDSNSKRIKTLTKRKFPGKSNQHSADLGSNTNIQSPLVCKKIKLNPGEIGDKAALKPTLVSTVPAKDHPAYAISDAVGSTGAVSLLKQNKQAKSAVRSTTSSTRAAIVNEIEAHAARQSVGKSSCVRISDVDVHTIDRFEVLTASALAVRYPRNFYKKLLGDIQKKEMIAKLAWWPGNCRAVGCICCRIEPVKRRLLIMTLSTMPTYRRRGVASELIRSVLKCTRAIASDLKDAYLHVQTSNKAALGFYQSMGFIVSHEIKNYYRRLKPPHCFVLTKSIC